MDNKKLRFILNAWVADTNERILLVESIVKDEFARGSVYDAIVSYADQLRVTLRAGLHTLDKLENPDGYDDDNIKN